MLGMGMLGKCATERLPGLSPLLSTRVGVSPKPQQGWGERIPSVGNDELPPPWNIRICI